MTYGQTHFIPWDVPKYRGVRMAACGRYVDNSQHDNVPECPRCQQYLADDDARGDDPFGLHDQPEQT